MDEHLLMSQLQAWSKSRSLNAGNKAEAALAKGLAAGDDDVYEYIHIYTYVYIYM
jgi:hypothetical protein